MDLRDVLVEGICTMATQLGPAYAVRGAPSLRRMTADAESSSIPGL